MDANVLKDGTWIASHFYSRQISLEYSLLEMYVMALRKEWQQVLGRVL
jgi:hypothetical protein